MQTTTPQESALRAVDAVHAALLVRYGAAWTRMHGDTPEDALRSDWARTFIGLTPAQLRYALDHLPDERAPTAGQFRSIARQMPQPGQMPVLPPPDTGGRRRVAQLMAEGLQRGMQAKAGLSDAQWLRRNLEQRVQDGTATAAHRAALAAMDAEAKGGDGPPLRDFRPIPESCWPPGMRNGGIARDFACELLNKHKAGEYVHPDRLDAALAIIARYKP